MCAKLQKDLQDLQATLYEESQKSLKLSMELDTKESELENVQLKLAHINLDTASLNSGLGGLGDPFLGSDGNLDTMESNMEGWLQVRKIRLNISQPLSLLISAIFPTGALQAEHPQARLEEALRHRLQQEDHILQLGGGEAERRPHTHPGPKVST